MVEPETWTLAFHRTSPWWWVRLLAFGRYKHVSALAWVGSLDLWLFYDIRLAGTQIVLLPDTAEARHWLLAQIADADLVSMPRRRRRGRWPMIAPFYCVAAVKHLLGLRCGALRLDSLYRHALANGGVLLTDGRPRATDAESGAVAPATGSPRPAD